jgi:hypothetical protein
MIESMSLEKRLVCKSATHRDTRFRDTKGDSRFHRLGIRYISDSLHLPRDIALLLVPQNNRHLRSDSGDEVAENADSHSVALGLLNLLVKAEHR